mgnify:CR=1 FL=1
MPMTAIINATTTGTVTVVAANPTGRIRVLGYHFGSTAGVGLTWLAGSTSLSGVTRTLADASVILPVSEIGGMVTPENTTLSLNLNGNATVGGYVVYDVL